MFAKDVSLNMADANQTDMARVDWCCGAGGKNEADVQAQRMCRTLQVSARPRNF